MTPERKAELAAMRRCDRCKRRARYTYVTPPYYLCGKHRTERLNATFDSWLTAPAPKQQVTP